MNTAFILRTQTANLRITFDFTYLYIGLKVHKNKKERPSDRSFL